MDLLREAIADAKAVKETAIANAKQALTEAFQPTISRMVSARLSEEEDDELEDLDNPAPEAPVAPEAPEAPVEDDEDDLELEAILRELDGDDEMGMEDEDLEEDFDFQNEDEFSDEAPVEDDEDLELEALIRELEGDDDMEDDEVMEGEEERYHRAPNLIGSDLRGTNESKNLKRENRTLKTKLSDAMKVVSYLKNTINEVNLLNAKLMYSAKVMRGGNIHESQRLNILNAFDRATSLREVKLIYSTIATNLKKESVKRNRVTESASRPIISQQKPAAQYSFVPRWQELAGVKLKK